PLHSRPPGRPVVAGPAAGRWLPPSATARQIDCRLRYRTRSCPSATAPPAARRARTHCSSAPRPPPEQTSTGPLTTCPTPRSAPPLCGPDSPARVPQYPSQPGLHRHQLPLQLLAVELPGSEAVPHGKQPLDYCQPPAPEGHRPAPVHRGLEVALQVRMAE